MVHPRAASASGKGKSKLRRAAVGCKKCCKLKHEARAERAAKNIYYSGAWLGVALAVCVCMCVRVVSSGRLFALKVKIC